MNNKFSFWVFFLHNISGQLYNYLTLCPQKVDLKSPVQFYSMKESSISILHGIFFYFP